MDINIENIRRKIEHIIKSSRDVPIICRCIIKIDEFETKKDGIRIKGKYTCPLIEEGDFEIVFDKSTLNLKKMQIRGTKRC